MTHDDRSSREFTSKWVTAQPVVTSFIYGLVRNRHDAEDLLQDVAGEAFSNFSRYDPERSFVAWATTIARHRVTDHFRRSNTRCELFDESTLSALAEAHERMAPTEGDRRLALDRCMKTLGERSRRVIVMRYNESIGVGEIADRMQTSTATVSTMLYKARKALAECIRRKVESEGEQR